MSSFSVLPRHRNRKGVGKKYQNREIHQNCLFHLITSRLRPSRKIPPGPRKITDDPISQNSVPRMIGVKGGRNVVPELAEVGSVIKREGFAGGAAAAAARGPGGGAIVPCHAIVSEYQCSSFRNPRKLLGNKHFYCVPGTQYKHLKTNGKSTIFAFPSTPGHCHEEPENEIPRHGILVHGIIGNEELGH